MHAELRDEWGEVLASTEAGAVAAALHLVDEEDSRCLRFIDPYGDTVFNELQAPLLNRELSNLIDLVRVEGLVPGPAPERWYTQMATLIAVTTRAEKEHGLYVWFVGD